MEKLFQLRGLPKATVLSAEPSSRSLALGLFVLALAACSDHSGDAVEAERPGDIILVTVDTLRADHLGIYGYARDTSPQIDRYFSKAAVFNRAYGANANTPPSVISMITGLMPMEHGVRKFYQLLSKDVPVISQLLPSEYQTAAFVSNMVLTDEAIGIADRFDHYDDLVDESESKRELFERSAPRTTDAALAWMQTERDPERPLLLWVHYIDPHGPYTAPLGDTATFEHEGFRRMERKRIHNYQRDPKIKDALDYVDAYDAEISFVDAEIGRLLAAYSVEHSIDDALLIFSADHGESMLEHEKWFTHGYQVYEEIIRVPLMVQGPDVDSGQRAGLVFGIDLVPTMLRFAGASALKGTSGVALQSQGTVPTERTIFIEGGGGKQLFRAAIQGNRKWGATVKAGQSAATDRWYYDLGQDPGELNKLDWPLGELEYSAQTLLDYISNDPQPGGLPQDFLEGVRIDAPKVAPRADAEDVERLRALGYVDGDDEED